MTDITSGKAKDAAGLELHLVAVSAFVFASFWAYFSFLGHSNVHFYMHKQLEKPNEPHWIKGFSLAQVVDLFAYSQEHGENRAKDCVEYDSIKSSHWLHPINMYE